MKPAFLRAAIDSSSHPEPDEGRVRFAPVASSATDGLDARFVASVSDGAEIMPLFYFDLFYDRYVVLDPGGMSFEKPARASEAADELARDLLTARSELRKSGSWIRVRDERGTELYRSSIDPETPAPAPA